MTSPVLIVNDDSVKEAIGGLFKIVLLVEVNAESPSLSVTVSITVKFPS